MVTSAFVHTAQDPVVDQIHTVNTYEEHWMDLVFEYEVQIVPMRVVDWVDNSNTDENRLLGSWDTKVVPTVVSNHHVYYVRMMILVTMTVWT